SLTGLTTSSHMLSVAGNNIANVNTTAYKRSRISFQTQISQTLANGSAPSQTSGGTNPIQIGMGAQLAAVRRDFSSGPLQLTGVSTDVALEGPGFFIVNTGGTAYYTRAGSFSLDRDFHLVTPSGAKLQGYGVDENFNINATTLGDVTIPLGALRIAEATGTVQFSGNLNAGGDVATQGSILTTQTLYADATATTTADATTNLNSIYDAAGNLLFQTGDVITLSGAAKGGAALPDRTFEVGPANTTGSDANGTTMQDLMDFLQAVLGIDTTISGGLSMAAGVLTIEGNGGTANDLDISDADFVVNSGGVTSSPLTFSKDQAADGESVRTIFAAFDSLGNPMNVELTVVLESKGNSGTTWRYYAQSGDDSDPARHLGTGVLSFDTQGQLTAISDDSITIDRDGTGAISPQTITLSFANDLGSVTALADQQSQIAAISQDGSPLGTLQDFNITEDGTIQGIFSNGLLRDLGRIPVAVFVNNEGLEEVGGSLFRPSANSGEATVVTATTGGSGRLIGRALELSNVDLADEFINLINASTGFSASSRVLTSSDRLLQELIATIR
ncbi:MAG TPA: flagellar hook-basal body complex protein, partial [Phycisphaeraceae bacterium]